MVTLRYIYGLVTNTGMLHIRAMRLLHIAHFDAFCHVISVGKMLFSLSE